MKNLPDKFPIRYALIIRNLADWDMDASLMGQERQRELLYKQLVIDLQQNPVTKERLTTQTISIIVTLLGIEIINLMMINKDEKEIKLFIKNVKDLLPNAEFEPPRFDDFIFRLSLYSYCGNYEIPALIRAYNKRDDLDYLYEKLELEDRPKIINVFYDIYQKMIKGNLRDWELYEHLNKYERPIYINSPYSELWKLLDSGALDGLIHTGYLFENKIIKSLKEKQYKQKIPIAICRSWESLFAEEISALYKMFRFCHNCGKALPFDYQGNYCPDTKENQQCMRERAKIRAQKKRKKSQI